LLRSSAFLLENLGAAHLTRTKIIENHTTVFAEKFFGATQSKLLLIADGELYL
jgi:hypothetical protein